MSESETVLGDNDRWEVCIEGCWHPVTAAWAIPYANRGAKFWHGPQDVGGESRRSCEPFSLAIGNLRRRPPEKDEWEWWDGHANRWSRSEVPDLIEATGEGYRYHINGWAKPATTYSNPPTLRRKQPAADEPESPAEPVKWEVPAFTGGWMALAPAASPALRRDGWRLSASQTEADGTLRPGPDLTEEEYAPYGWEFCYGGDQVTEGAWYPVWHDMHGSLRRVDGGWELGGVDGWGHYTTDLSTLRPKRPPAEPAVAWAAKVTNTLDVVNPLSNRLDDHAASIEALYQRANELNAARNHLSRRVDSLEQAPDVTPELAHLRDALDELRGLVEERDIKPGNVLFDEPVKGLPCWAESDDALKAACYWSAEGSGLKPGDTVWDKITGDGPWVFTHFHRTRSGFAVLWSGVHAPGGPEMVAHENLRPAVALTTTPPEPPPSRLVPVLWAVVLAGYAVCISYIVATVMGAL